MKPLSSLLALWLFQAGAAQAIVYVADSSLQWAPITGNFDYHIDQQTGKPSGDIVGGTGANFGFLMTFNDNGSVSAIDGTLGFRVRLDDAGGNNNNPEYTNVVWVGIDADASGSLDLFLGVNMQGNDNTDAIEIRAPGAGLNISPSTTTIANTTFRSYSLDTIEDATPANYNYRPVDSSTDGGNTNDLTQTTSGDPDYYLSFMVPFADIVEYLGGLQTPVNITDQTPLRFVVATSTQVNSLNQDIGGVNGGVSSDTPWEDLGAFTPPTPPVTLIPEPSSSLLILGSLAAGCFIRRRR